MLTPSGNKIILVENPVVFVRHQVHHQAQPLGVRHCQQVLRRVVQIAAVVHVDMCRAAPPSRLRNRGRADQPQRHLRGFPRLHLNRGRRRLKFEAAHRFDRHFPSWNLDRVFALGMKAVLGGPSDAGVGVRGRVKLAIRREAVDPRRF